MKLKFVFSFIASSLSLSLFAQSKPYFQQEVNHKIDVRLDDKSHMLRGFMTMTYKNNSSDTLRFLYLHIYPNAYSSDRSAFAKQNVENGNKAFYLAAKKDWGFIDSLDFQQEETPCKVALTGDVDIIRLMLPQPLLPGAQTSISTPFRVKIPLTFSRMGHQGNTYQISQWFPKPAVYDNEGWHPYPYLDQGEFFSEYGAYDVSITLPENYVVMATGNLQTASEEAWLDNLSKKSLPDDAQLAAMKNIPSATAFKTLRYTEDHVHDFAWFADKSWIVQKDTVAVPGSNNIATVYTAFHPSSIASWKSSVKAVKDAVRSYSKLVGPYPYKTVKAVEGALSAGGGMEYPTITVIAPNMGMLNDAVIIHEVGHNWFYGLLGSNERMRPWMDEGLNSYFEKITTSARSGASNAAQFMNRIEERSFTYDMAMHRDQALGLPAYEYTDTHYGTDVYHKTPAYLNWLSEYMGQDNFEAAMHEYFDTWKYKHPQVEDFAVIFRKHTDKNLDWFFTDGLNSGQGVDFKIKSVKQTPEGRLVRVKNKTGFLAPVALQNDGDKDNLRWTEPFTGSKDVLIKNDFNRVRVASFIPDYNESNNSNKNGYSIGPFMGFRSSPERRLFLAPALAYNIYDRFMLGLAFHNVQNPERSFQYFFAPMYGFGSKTLVGNGFLSQAFYPNADWLQEIDLNVEAKRFSYIKTFLEGKNQPRQQFLKVAPELRFIFKKASARSSIDRYLSIKGYYIQEGYFDYIFNTVDSTYHPERGGSNAQVYGKLRYQLDNKRTFNPYDLGLEAQFGEGFAKLSLEANLKIDYFYKSKAIYFRVFGGKMFDLGTAANSSDIARYSFAATYSGWNDYLYDQTYLGRNAQSTLASQQIYIKDGGMKFPTLMYANEVGLTQDWMAAVNVKVDLPVKWPVQVFADFLSIADAKNVNAAGSKWLYDAGISVRFLKFMDVYVPLFMSTEYSDYKKSIIGKNSFLKTLAFKFDLDKLYWSRFQRQVRLF